MASFEWPSTGGGGVPVYPTFGDFPAGTYLGEPAIAADTGTLYVWNGTTWVAIAAPGDALAIGAYDGQPGVSNGLQIVTDLLYAQSATAVVPGMVNTGAQTFAGNKTFTGTLSASNLSGTNTGDVTIGTANGLSLVAQVLSLALATNSTPGGISTTGDLTDAGTDGIIITNGTNAVVGAGTTIAQSAASTTQNGYLSAANFTVFNSKLTSTLSSGDIFVGSAGNVATDVTMSGDATISSSGVLTLATINANVGSFGSSTAIPSFTVNSKGLITAVSTNAVIAPAATLTGTVLASNVVSSSLTSVGTISSGVWNGTTIAAGFGGTGSNTVPTNAQVPIGNAGGTAYAPQTVSGDATLTNTGALTLATVNVNVGSFTLANITVNAKGLITAASSTTLSFSDSIVNTAGVVTLVNDSAVPGNSFYYGTNASGTKGFFTLPAAGTGTVTSVAMTVPTFLSISGTPITTSGTLALTLNSGTPLPITSGGTGNAVSPSANQTVVTGSSGAYGYSGPGTAGYLFTSNGTSGVPTYQQLNLGTSAALAGILPVTSGGTGVGSTNAIYALGTPTGTISSSFNTVIYPTVSYNSGSGSYASGVYTTGIAGFFNVAAGFSVGGTTFGIGSYVTIALIHNGTAVAAQTLRNDIGTSNGTFTSTISFSGIQCASGDTIAIQSATNYGTPIYTTGLISPAENFFTIAQTH